MLNSQLHTPQGALPVKRLIMGLLLGALFCATEPASAGPFADDMARCLVNSTSPEDRTLLVKWIFSLIALHPDLTAMSSVSAQQRDDLSKSAGALFQRLLLESCRSQTQQALQNEGPQTFQYAFQVLGQVATRGIFADPHVTAGLKNLSKYVDEEKLKALNAAAPQK
jgi:hypothetical protein